MLRRSLHILRTSLTILSLMLFVATTTLWVRSYWAADILLLSASDDSTNVAMSSNWGVLGAWGVIWPNNGFGPWAYSSALARQIDKRDFRLEHQVGPGATDYRLISVPHWFLALLFAILPTLKLRAILRARKQTRGFEVVGADFIDPKSDVG